MKIRAILMPTLCLIAIAGISFATGKDNASSPAAPSDAASAKQYESFGNTQIIDMEPVKSMFSHKSHVVSYGLSCDSCHPSLFERKRGAAKAKGDYNHVSHDAGKYCGACHDGSTAFSTTEPQSCKTCHGSDMKQPEIVIFNRPVKGVLFTHKEHVDMGLTCASCHDSAFEMRVGAAEEHPEKFNMQALYAGTYCGVCHNGNIAFASNTRCASCHSGVRGVERMMNKKAAPGTTRRY